MSKHIASFLATFERRKTNLNFDVHDGTAYIYLVTDGMQLADVTKLLLLKGKEQVFRVRIYEEEQSRQASDVQDAGRTTKKDTKVF